jgi:hypothetical protein
VASPETVRTLWLGLLAWAVLCAATTRGRARGSWSLGAAWRCAHLFLLLCLLYPVADGTAVVTPLPTPLTLLSVRGLTLVALLVTPAAGATLHHLLARRRDRSLPLWPRGLLGLEASVLRAFGWFGVGPAAVAAAPWLFGLPLELRDRADFLVWLAWIAVLLLKGALVEAMTRRRVTRCEMTNRPLAQAMMAAVWAFGLLPVFQIGTPSLAVRGDLILTGASLLLSAALAHLVHVLIRDRLGMPAEEVFAPWRALKRRRAPASSRGPAGRTTTAPDPPPDRPAEPDDAPTSGTPSADAR